MKEYVLLLLLTSDITSFRSQNGFVFGSSKKVVVRSCSGNKVNIIARKHASHFVSWKLT
jgi:hypothetical protein